MNSKTRFYLIMIIFLAFMFTFIHFNFSAVQATATRGGSAIVRASVGVDVTQANDDSSYAAISGNGRYVAFNSVATNLVPNDTNGGRDVFVYDRQTGQTVRVSVATAGTQGSGDSGESAAPPAISEDEAFQLDRQRDNLAQLAGWIILRFTWDDIVKRPSYVIATVRDALNRTSRA
jgi:hypothetical protein